jgi:hypothetical protein
MSKSKFTIRQENDTLVVRVRNPYEVSLEQVVLGAIPNEASFIGALLLLKGKRPTELGFNSDEHMLSELGEPQTEFRIHAMTTKQFEDMYRQGKDATRKLAGAANMVGATFSAPTIRFSSSKAAIFPTFTIETKNEHSRVFKDFIKRFTDPASGLTAKDISKGGNFYLDIIPRLGTDQLAVLQTLLDSPQIHTKLSHESGVLDRP